MARDSHLEFPPNWNGSLPSCATRDALRDQVAPMLKRRNLSVAQGEELLDFLEHYENRYYEAPGGQCYHRACGGGAMVQGEGGIFCAKCGKLPDMFPPTFMR